VVVGAVLVIFAIGLYALPDAFAELTITDDATGGDCSTVGTWDAGTRTCTFTSDVSESIVIMVNNLTLNGNGHTLDSPASNHNQICNSNGQYYDEKSGISFNAKTNIVIKNFTIKNFCDGIKFANSINNSILDNTFIENWASGVYLGNSNDSIISNNVFTNNGYHGVVIDYANNDIISNNVFTSNGIAYNGPQIQLHQSSSYSITGNTITTTTYDRPSGQNLATSGIRAHMNENNGVASVIENNNISNVNTGIEASSTSVENMLEIKNNILDRNYTGIDCQRCIVSYNTITNHDEDSNSHGIRLGYYSVVSNNLVSDNSYGIQLYNNDHYAFRNTISNNAHGLYTHSGSSWISENTFLNNVIQATGTPAAHFDRIDPGSYSQEILANVNPHTLDNFGYSGNYWNDYSHLCDDNNNDNLCDDPYPFSGGSINVHDDYVWTVQDGWLTQINTPGNITLEAPDNSGAVGTYSAVSATHDGSAMSVTCDTSSGATIPIGTTSVVCTAQNGIKSTFDVTVNLETISPVINVPADMTINLPQGSTNSTATFSVDATDNFAVTVGPTCSAESGDTFQIGSNTVTCTAADAAGNVGNASFIISVIEYDSTPPTVSVPSDMTLDEIASNVGAVGVFSVSATDNVDGSITPTCSHSSGTQFSVGSTIVTCTAQDANGNTGTASFTITVTEYVAPYLNTSNTRFVDTSDVTVSEVSIGQQAQIKADLVNNQNSDQQFAFLVSYTGATSDVMWLTGSLSAGQSFTPSLSWTPQETGDYTFTIRVVDDWDYCISYDSSTGKNVVDISSQCVVLADSITLQMNVPLPPQATTIQNAQGSSSPGCEPNCFIPSQASVAVGDTVTFVNNDLAAHTTTAGTPADGPSGAWDSSVYMSGSSYSVTLSNSGTYPYFCMVHPWMTGTIYVGTGIPEASQPDAELNLSLSKSEFDLDELITVGASISDNSGTSDVTIDVIDPNGTPIITRTLQVGSSSEQLDFRISDRFLVGYYKISASSNVNGNVITDNVFFNIKSQYDKFQIQTVQVTDQQGNASTLQRGEMAHIKVTLTSNINIEPLVTVNLFDSSLTTLGVGSIRTPINEGESEIILSFLIPEDAALGGGIIYVNAFTDWISNGGVSLTGEVSKTENIS